MDIKAMVSVQQTRYGLTKREEAEDTGTEMVMVDPELVGFAW
jgi:hypothetical protein